MEQILRNRPILVLSFAVVVLSVFFGIALWKWQAKLQLQGSSEEKPLEGLKEFGSVPQFSLLERSGRQVTLSDLKGEVWIVNFIYTNCPDTCPIQSAQLRQIQEDFMEEKDLRVVSITVDPKRDTPEVLSEYAKRFSADPGRWLFLTGEKEDIYKFAQEGFHLGAAELPYEKRPESGATHTHSPRFVLIDREAQIRGYYVSTDGEAMKRLRRDLEILLRGEKWLKVTN
jgi:protein SCO1/2